MRWREVKILCAGMCVCTVIAALNPVAEKAKTYADNDVAFSVEEQSTDAGIAEVGEHMVPRVGAGNAYSLNGQVRNVNMDDTLGESEVSFNKSILGEPQSVADMQLGCDITSIDPEEAMGQAGLQQAESNLIIADVTNYVNVRSLPSEEGEILGKLYDDSVGRRMGEENGWYLIESGSVQGYVKADYVLTGEAAEIRAREVGTRLAEVTTTTLKVRREPSMEAAVLGLVPIQEVLNVLAEVEGWVKVDFEDGNGYVSTDYVRVYTENVEAESKAEEAARLKKEEEERKKAEEAAKKALAAQQANKPSSGNGSSSKPSSSGSGSTSSGGSGSSGSSGSGSASGSTSTANLGQEIANYALKFLGNPYVYGGTSLTNGTDCSGFVQSVYKHFGISLPRTSGEQGKAGRAVDGVANAKPGDLVWYSGHIGIYIGNEQIVHASNPKNGIITSNVYYRNILGIRRIV